MTRVETVAEHCKHKDCIYWGRLNGHMSIPTCDYMLLTGFSRKCKISDCNKYARGKKRRVNKLEYIGTELEIFEEDEL